MLAGAIGFLVVTVALGITMRVDQTNGFASRAGFLFVNLRHAHSHAGFYGLLTLAAWLASAQHTTFGPRGTAIYAGLALTSSTLFSFIGYRPITIVLSTVIAATWLFVAWRHQRARSSDQRTFSDQFFAVLVIGTALIPVIAISAKRDLMLSRQVAHLFIGWLLLGLFLPAALQALGVARRIPVALYLGIVALTLARVIFGPSLPAVMAVFPVVAAGLMVEILRHSGLPRGWLALWSVWPITTALSALPMFSGEPWRIAGVHMWILGLTLPSLARALFGRNPPLVVVALYLVTLTWMLGSIVGLGLTIIPGISPVHTLALASTTHGTMLVIAAVHGWMTRRRSTPT